MSRFDEMVEAIVDEKPRRLPRFKPYVETLNGALITIAVGPRCTYTATLFIPNDDDMERIILRGFNYICDAVSAARTYIL